MKLNQDYVDKLRKMEYLQFGKYSIDLKNILHLPDSSRGVLYEDITKIDFNLLYANIQIGLFNEGLIDKKWKEDIERVQWFIKNRVNLKSSIPNEYQKWKIFCNSLYTKIESPYVVEYLDMFYTDLLEKYSDLIIYNDVDSLYLNIDKISFQTREWVRNYFINEIREFTYDITQINYFYIESEKKYIEQEESGVINTVGFRLNKEEEKRDKLLNIIKTEIRTRKLNKLGI